MSESVVYRPTGLPGSEIRISCPVLFVH